MGIPFNYILSTVAFRDLPLAEAIVAAEKLGYSRLEIWQRHIFETPDSSWPGMVRELKDRGMSVPVVAPFLSFTRGEERMKETRHAAQKSIEIAGMLGSSRIRTFTDVGRDGLGSARADEGQWKAASSEIALLCQRHPHLLFVVETHPWTLADGMESTERLLREVSQPNFKINFQPIAPFLDAGLFGVIERFFPHIAHMHWHQIKADGGFGYLHESGRVNFQALVAFLNKHGYEGTVTVEYCWPGAEWDPMRQDVDFLRKLTPGLS